MKIVLTADDFGWDDDTVATTIAALEAGHVRNASLMACTPGAEAAMAYATSHPEHGYGVHLTFTRDEEEAPLLPPGQVPDLVDADGRFHLGREAQLRAGTGRFPTAQIAAEMEAQLAFIVDHGVALDYVDSHKHLHKFGPFAAALPEVLPRFGIETVRNAQTIFVGSTGRRPTAWFGRRWSRRIERRWRTTDHFFMADGDIDVAWWEHVPLDLGDRATLEVGCHPGTDVDWRDHERHGIEQLADRISAAGIETLRWRDLAISESAPISN